MQCNLQGELTLMDNLEMKPNYAALGRKYGMDWRTVKKYHEGYKGKPDSRDKPSIKSQLQAYQNLQKILALKLGSVQQEHLKQRVR